MRNWRATLPRGDTPLRDDQEANSTVLGERAFPAWSFVRLDPSTSTVQLPAGDQA